jgi:hypothetical protein
MRSVVAAGLLSLLAIASSGSRSVLAAPRQNREPTQIVDNDAKEEVEAVLSMLVPAAIHLLEKNGGMFPIGAAMSPNGSVSAVAAFGGDEHPSDQKVIDGLNDLLRAGARKGLYKASGIAIDGEVPLPGRSEKTSALVVRLEHVSGYSVRVVYPYQRHGGKITLGKTFAAKGTNDVFGPH